MTNLSRALMRNFKIKSSGLTGKVSELRLPLRELCQTLENFSKRDELNTKNFEVFHIQEMLYSKTGTLTSIISFLKITS